MSRQTTYYTLSKECESLNVLAELGNQMVEPFKYFFSLHLKKILKACKISSHLV